MLGALLLKAKYWILKRLENGGPINSREDLKVIDEELEKEIRQTGLKGQFLSASLNPFILLHFYSQSIEAINKLGEEEIIEYKSRYGNARVNSGISFDKAKIISELGEQTLQNETVELLRIKKMDMLSDEARWDFKKDHHA